MDDVIVMLLSTMLYVYEKLHTWR